MTLYDELGPYAGDLATWAEEREEPWPVDALAFELYARDLVRRPEDLHRYRAAVRADITAVGILSEDVAATRERLAGVKITWERFKSAYDALERMTVADVHRAAASIATAQMEADYGAERYGLDRSRQARKAQEQAFEALDRAQEADAGGAER